MSKGSTVTSSTYCDLHANHLKPRIRSEPHGLLSASVLLQHCTLSPYCLCKSCNHQGHAFQVPPSSSILAWPCHFQLPYIWGTQGGNRQKDLLLPLRNVKGSAWVSVQTTKGFFQENLKYRWHWRKCNGDYVENEKICTEPTCNIQAVKEFLRFSFHLPT